MFMINVYLICSEIHGEKLHKIGFTKRDISVRLKEFKTGNAANLYLVDSFRSKWGTNIESNFHRILKSKRVKGEWFKLDDEDIKTFKEKCQTIHDNLNFLDSNNNVFVKK